MGKGEGGAEVGWGLGWGRQELGWGHLYSGSGLCPYGDGLGIAGITGLWLGLDGGVGADLGWAVFRSVGVVSAEAVVRVALGGSPLWRIRSW